MTSGASAGGDDESGDFVRSIFRAGGAVVLLVVSASIAFGSALGEGVDEAVSVAGSAVIIAAAAGGVGTLLGFLFGIPRTMQRETIGSDEGPRYLANTNLEQISDWLTKILVGISLVQIGNAGPALGRLAEALAPMLGDEAASPGFGLALCIVSALAAFVLSYLWTRVRLRRELQIADRDVEATVRMVVNEQASVDALALSLVDRQVTGDNIPDYEDLVHSLEVASKPVLVQAFQRAEAQRRRSWRDPSQRSEHDRTIAVFRALVAKDKEQRFHRHFGSLGFALKDRSSPDYRGAIDALTTAIRVRGDVSRAGFAIYEWNRAVCRILMLDGRDDSATPEMTAEIEADLTVSAKYLSPRLLSPSDDDPTVAAVARWLESHRPVKTDLEV